MHIWRQTETHQTRAPSVTLSVFPPKAFNNTYILIKIEFNWRVIRTYHLLSVAWTRPSEEARLGNARQSPETRLDDGGWGEVRNVFVKKLLDQVLQGAFNQAHYPILYQ